jgi:Domain of unknown function (DUF6285)
MNDRPDATELLDIARRTLLDELLPRLPEDLRYSALMIANAMAIASREHAGGDTAAHAEFARLRELFSERAKPLSGAALEAALAGYNRRLATEIRGGRYDDKERAALLDHLDKTTTDKLAVANPRALKS